jgi:hypothetical protein
MVYTGTYTKMYLIYNMEETKIVHCNKTKIDFSVFWSNSSTFQYVGEILLPFIFEASLI